MNDDWRGIARGEMILKCWNVHVSIVKWMMEVRMLLPHEFLWIFILLSIKTFEKYQNVPTIDNSFKEVQLQQWVAERILPELEYGRSLTITLQYAWKLKSTNLAVTRRLNVFTPRKYDSEVCNLSIFTHTISDLVFQSPHLGPGRFLRFRTFCESKTIKQIPYHLRSLFTHFFIFPLPVLCSRKFIFGLPHSQSTQICHKIYYHVPPIIHNSLLRRRARVASKKKIKAASLG